MGKQELSEKEVIDILNEAGGIDEHLSYIMRELEICDDMIYNENLSAANYIYWKTRKEVFTAVRDNYCDFKEKLKKGY